MLHLRAFFHLRPRAALALLALALAMKAMVPAGTMLDGAPNAMTVRICDGAAPDTARSIALPAQRGEAAAKATHDHQACPFSVLGLSLVGGADPVLLALALVFVLLAGLAPRAPVHLARFGHLRPPLRAPPLAI